MPVCTRGRGVEMPHHEEDQVQNRRVPQLRAEDGLLVRQEMRLYPPAIQRTCSLQFDVRL